MPEISALGPIDPSTVPEVDEEEKAAPWIMRKLVGVSSTFFQNSPSVCVHQSVAGGDPHKLEAQGLVVGNEQPPWPSPSPQQLQVASDPRFLLTDPVY